jgi:hypothetical protein
MAFQWPLSLPVNPSNYNEQKQPVTIHSQPDSGPRKSRRRFTKAVTKGTMTYTLTNAQATILDDFWTNTLDSGAEKVLMRHPWRGNLIEMRIPDAPSFSDDGPLQVKVTFAVEYL